MELVKPSSRYKQSYLAYIKELGDEERYPFTLDLDFTHFDQLLITLDDYSQGKNLPSFTVQNTTLWLVEGEELVGVTNLRHCLNAQIEHCGGHVGLGIRPSSRGKGLGNLLMQLSIEKLTTMGVKHVHIHCYKSNVSSAKTITNNGGELASEFEDAGQTIQRYLVNV
ncbi:GNAT family N-acetyltransferase [Thalassotalea euphylliae]|uniref:GNAT family N-acetyltransferase n=1 Tax=Thalassotalea euphylliae TaxID=1655234 RepID=UPI003633B9D4